MASGCGRFGIGRARGQQPLQAGPRALGSVILAQGVRNQGTCDSCYCSRADDTAQSGTDPTPHPANEAWAGSESDQDSEHSDRHKATRKRTHSRQLSPPMVH